MTQTPPSNAPLVVVLDDGYGDNHTEALALQSLAARVVLRPCHGRAEAVRQAVEGADAVMVRESPIDAEAIARMPACRAIVRYGVGVGVMVAPRWDPWFWGPPYPYTPYPPVIIERAPPVYIEQPQAVPQPAPQPAYWYYCAESNNYYPYVQRCPSGWDRIEPQPGDLR